MGTSVTAGCLGKGDHGSKTQKNVNDPRELYFCQLYVQIELETLQ